MAHSVVAATNDTIRLWDLSVHSSTSRQSSYQGLYLGRRRGSSSGSADHSTGQQPVRVSEEAQIAAKSSAGAIDRITAVSWAADGATFVVGGKGTCMRQYSRAGEALQDIRLAGRVERPVATDIAAVQHYGGAATPECLFVANNTTRQVRRWDMVKREYTAVCQTHEHDISCLAVSAKRRLIASATAQGGEISLFNLLYNTRTDLRSATQRALTCIDISSGLHRSQVAVGSEDGLLQLFDATRSDTSPTKTFPLVHAAPIRGLTFSRDSASTITSVGLDSRIVVTDPRAFSNRDSVAMAAGAPLTCLATGFADASVVAAGSIDGDVLIYDIRAPSAPVWKASVGTRKAVVSVQLVQQAADDSAAADDHVPSKTSALHRSASAMASQHEGGSRVAGRVSARSGHNSSDDSPVSTLLSERRRLRGALASGPSSATHDGRPPVASASAGADHRPPQHPSIHRFRTTLSELRRSAATAKSQPKPTLASSPKVSEPTPGGDDVDMEAEEEHLDNMAILAKDRSYMELLSPAKPKQVPSPIRNTAPAPNGGTNDIFAMLARSNRNPIEDEKEKEKEPEPQPQQQQHRQTLSTRSKRHYDYDSDDFTDEFGASPLARPCAGGRAQDPQRRHDVGDSMMEMFTPERKKRDIAKKPGHNAHEPNQGAGSGGGLAQTLVAQLLNKQNEKDSGDKAESAQYENILDDSPPASANGKQKSPEKPRPTVDSLTRKETRDTRNGFSFRMDPVTGHKSSSAMPPPPLPPMSRNRSVAADAPLSALSAGSSASTKTDLDPIRPPLHKTADQTKEPPASTGQPPPDAPLQGATMSAMGLGSVSSNVLQNMLSDALVPLREQFSSQIRNLHLDMIRQCFVYQEQVQALRTECSESQLLREEVERLRQENEELKRYIPLYHAFDKDVNVPDTSSLRRSGR
ncbi:hypothetical protein IW140_001009 [Coemansia sp. RSA 1813]|nr:hypothetical protein EV178_004253 [Coemansia sp. RSA 1646]KAJ1770783.1 hypothetical protein LPJ74_002914 [Coemansia sp. RSA 1843]KAJ2091540.1 hypothetical protein IW138_001768 [Coemansia sp. RSA 986]KAJ2215160.1 hypothetical protein EV179_002379 [Coemansia sp. RSA 487]KAJ2572260.1 hypothetical protein IW140_001009 [Coemansia sp. RSA 1813]